MRYSGSFNISLLLDWIKAANTPSFICIQHILQQALKRLSSPDFTKLSEPCSAVVQLIQNQITELLPEVTADEELLLPYIMANFKFHKMKNRWLNNAHDCCFSILADLLTTSTNAILPQLRSWAAQKC